MDTDQDKHLCIVTIHGIGFQQPPEEGVDGYADDLHANLCAELNKNGSVLLGDDPDRDLTKHTKERQNTPVPIYVSSVWPDQSGVPHREKGLMRLGSWMDQHRRVISYDRRHDPNQALVKDNAAIAHIALVYSQLEGEGRQPVADIEAAGEAIIYRSHYTNFKGLLETIKDFQPFLSPIKARLTGSEEPSSETSVTQSVTSLRPSLRVRQDSGYCHPHHHIGTTSHPSGLLAVFSQLENDVAAYVCHNELRQRIRSFVLDALLRLASRDDVSGIILNTHSNGTLIALDVIQELPPDAAQKIRYIITAGSPIRKYIDLFNWGKQLAIRPTIDQWVERWVNFFDEKDIVADRLRPRPGWVRGKEFDPEDTGIYETFDLSSGRTGRVQIIDKQVYNIRNSPVGGLQAHNYWDNTKEFIPKVVEIVRTVDSEIREEMKREQTG